MDSLYAFQKSENNSKLKLIFEDDFERNESDEEKEELGNGWSTNSSKRAGGNKQVDLREGTMHIYMHKAADHAVSVRHDAQFQNGEVHLRFMLENEKDILGLNFADSKLKSVWAGHLFKVNVGIRKLEILDLKTGQMDLKIRDQRRAKKVTPETKKLLATKVKRTKLKLDIKKWYQLRVKIHGDTLTLFIDNEEKSNFSSKGFAHPTKRMLRVAVPREAVIDDLKIFSVEEK